MLVGDEWVELLECGLAGGHVLRAGGLDPSAGRAWRSASASTGR